MALRSVAARSKLVEALVLLAAGGCSVEGEPSTAAGSSAGSQGSSAGRSNGSGGSSGASTGGALPAGSGGAGTAGGGTAGTAGGAGSAGTANVAGSGGFGGAGGDGVERGGAAGGSGDGGASAGTAGESGGAGAGDGGRAGSAGNDGGGTAGEASGGGAGGGALGCDWMNPEGRISLFDGTTLSSFRNSTTGGAAPWRLVDDGSMEVVPANPSTNVETTMKFEDLCLHLEYQTPAYPANVTGQQRGNSGIYFKRSYEMQVLDTYGQPPAIDGCGAVYGIAAPLEVACNMQLVWNTYEIEFKASRWDGQGTKTENAVFVTATLNGTVVQRDVELDVPSTTAGQPDASGAQALMLQDHGNPVRFRNIWAKLPRY